ncbi:MAG: hypothetical protein KDN19_17870 [Verrucomicrobiae bacterium]|nr:hypothetical protein [Verrucomicrobiae bacterium]
MKNRVHQDRGRLSASSFASAYCLSGRLSPERFDSQPPETTLAIPRGSDSQTVKEDQHGCQQNHVPFQIQKKSRGPRRRRIQKKSRGCERHEAPDPGAGFAHHFGGDFPGFLADDPKSEKFREFLQKFPEPFLGFGTAEAKKTIDQPRPGKEEGKNDGPTDRQLLKEFHFDS